MKLLLWSDLHVRVQTLATAIDVMRTVRKLAEEHGAKPVFMGDFWDVANLVDTACLNAVIAELEQWRGLNAWWLVGNHDQVDIGGLTHGLDVVRAICPDALVATEPVRNGRVQLVPYRRDKQAVLDVLKDVHDENTNVVLCHVDILGAQFNDKVQSFHGIGIGSLPFLPIFTGHYHKPHAVSGAEHIVYVGSQYQTGFSEAGQQKRVILVDVSSIETARQWQSLPIDHGPRHHSLDAETGEPPELRAGDKVVLKVSEPGGSPEQREYIEELRAAGVTVEVHVSGTAQKRSRIENVRDLDAGATWAAYAVAAHLNEETTAAGAEVLATPNLWIERSRQQMDVEFIAVDVQGYGPFLDKQTYPLDKRGAVMLAGRNLDDPGSQSNGAGKSTVVFAAHWALTGRTDPRPDGNVMKGLADEMVNDDAKDAVVELECAVNGKPLIVTRSMGKGGHKLGVNYDGRDCSGQTVALSQKALDSIIDTDLLCRTVFFGQHATRGFLEATDSAAKEQLSEVVSMAPWEAAQAHVKGRISVQEANIAKQRTEMGILDGRVAEIDVFALEARSAEWEVARNERIDVVNGQLAERGLESHAWSEARTARHVEHLASIAGIEVESAAWDAEHSKEEAAALAETVAAKAAVDEWERARAARIADVQLLVDAAKGEQASIVPPATIASRDELRTKVGLLREPLPASPETRAALLALTAAQKAKTDADKLVADSLATGKARREEHDRRLAAHVVERAKLADQTAQCPTCNQAVGVDKHAQLLADLDARHAVEKKALEAGLADARATYNERKAAADAATLAFAAAEDAQKTMQAADVAVQQSRMAELAALEPQLSAVQAQIDNAQAVARAKVQGYEGQIAGIRAERCPINLASAQTVLTMVQAQKNPHAARIASARAVADAILREQNPVDRAILALSAQRDGIAKEVNPHEAAKASASERLDKLLAERDALVADIAACEAKLDVLIKLEVAFSRTGVQNYVMEEVLGDLQSRVHRYLDGLSGGYLSLELRASSVGAKGKVSEKFSKRVQVMRRDGRYVERAVQQLSGGQWRRESTAMTLAFAEFVASRTGIRSNLLVLDEVFQHLDPIGRARVAGMVRDLEYDTILVITHDIDLASVFETVDLVVMRDDVSTIFRGVDPHAEIEMPKREVSFGPVKGARKLSRKAA